MQKFKQLLNDKKQELLNNIKNLSDQMSTTISFIDTLDFAANESNKNVLSELKNKDLQTIGKIEYALAKIDKHTFGECEECGEFISVKRLTLLPTATHCMDCQESKESYDRKHKTIKQRLMVDDEHFFDKEEDDKSGAV